MSGFYVIGYSINNRYCYLPELYHKNVIGAFGVTNHKRALFIYKTVTVCEGFFIRKKNWNEILDSDPEIVKSLKKNIFLEFLLKLRLKILAAKRRAI